MLNRIITLSTFVILLSACGGGGGSNNSQTTDNSPVLTGQFIDSEVVNLKYETDTQSGLTNKKGEYKYKKGETVTFSIGDLKFPSVLATGIVTPLTLAYTNNINDRQSTNISRLLLSLDVDNNPENGIEIDTNAKNFATQVNFNLSSDDFANDSKVVSLIENSNSSTTNIVTPSEAKTHLSNSIIFQNFKYLLSQASKGDILLFNNVHDCSGDACYYETNTAGVFGEPYGFYSHAAMITSISSDKKSVNVFHAAGSRNPLDSQVLNYTYKFEDLLKGYSRGSISLLRVKNTTQDIRNKVISDAISKYDSYGYVSVSNILDISIKETYCSALVRDAWKDHGYTLDDSDELEGYGLNKLVFTPDELASSKNIKFIGSMNFGFDEDGTDLNDEIGQLELDERPPVISLNGLLTTRIIQNEPYIDAGAVAFDNVDGPIGLTINTDNVDTSTVGTYRVTFTATDASDNEKTITRIVIVEEAPISDVTPPVITLNGSPLVRIKINQPYVDAGATAVDHVDGDVTVEINTDNVDTTVLGIYTVVFKATDGADNEEVAIRRVIVEEEEETTITDTTPPVIKITGANPVTIKVGNQYIDKGATATDDVDDEVAVNRSGSVNKDEVGIYTITYTATDEANNTATATRTVNVEAEAPIPNIDSIIFSSSTIEVGKTLVTHVRTNVDVFKAEIRYSNGVEFKDMNSTSIGWSHSRVFESAGIKTVEVRIYDENGIILDESSKTISATIGVLTVYAGSDKTIQEGQNAVLDIPTVSGGTGVSRVVWQLNEVNTPCDKFELTTCTVSGLSVNSHTIYVTVTSDDGQQARDEVNITVQATVVTDNPPQAVAGNDQTINFGDNITLDGSASSDDIGISSYEWKDQNGNILSTNATFSTSALAVGTWTIQLTVTDTIGNTDSDVVTVTVNQVVSSSKYTKISSTGATLPDSATQWSCTKDNETGLIWEVKTDDGGLHDKHLYYEWYNPDPSTNGGDAGTENGNQDTDSFVSDVNSASYCGASDWRMPTITELTSIVDLSYSDSNEYIDIRYFPNNRDSHYWSSTTDSSDSTHAWSIFFYFGNTDSQFKIQGFYVRLVREQ